MSSCHVLRNRWLWLALSVRLFTSDQTAAAEAFTYIEAQDAVLTRAAELLGLQRDLIFDENALARTLSKFGEIENVHKTLAGLAKDRINGFGAKVRRKDDRLVFTVFKSFGDLSVTYMLVADFSQGRLLRTRAMLGGGVHGEAEKDGRNEPDGADTGDPKDRGRKKGSNLNGAELGRRHF